MAYDQINAFGVQRGLVSPAEQMQSQQADAMRRAQMAALMSSGSPRGGAPAPAADDPVQTYNQAMARRDSNEAIGYGGIPLQQVAGFELGNKAAHDTQTLKGSQEMDLAKEQTNRAFGSADRYMAPSNIEAKIRQERFEMEKPGLQSDAEFNSYINSEMLKTLKGGNGQDGTPNALVGGVNGPSVGGGGMDALLKIMQAKKGLPVTSSGDDAYNKSVRDLQLDALRREAEAGKGKVAATTPIEEYVGANAGLTSPLAKMSGDFATKDTDMFGWDPEDQDVDRILDEVARIQQILETKGYDTASAQREAQRIVTSNLGTEQNDVNNGWIKELLRRMAAGGRKAPKASDMIDNSGPMM